MVIAATNRISSLDSALLRPGRFDRHVELDLPDADQRLQILKVHVGLQNIRLAGSPEAMLRACAEQTPNFSGADLANLVNEAVFLSLRRQGRGSKGEVASVDLEGAVVRAKEIVARRNGGEADSFLSQLARISRQGTQTAVV